MPGQLMLDFPVTCAWCGDEDNENCDHDANGNCIQCGEGEGEHDRCCSIGLDLYYANIDLQIGE